MSNKPTTTKLTVTEWARLKELETVIHRGQQTFVEVGLALAEVKESKLYREKYGTFEEYCQKKWGWTRQRAYQLIEASATVKSLPPKCQELLTSANSAEAVSKVPEEHRAKVVEEAAKAGPVTAASIATAAEKREEKKPAPVMELDKTGHVIPPSILQDWNRAAEFSDVLRKLSEVKGIVEKALTDDDVVMREVTNTSLAALKNVYGDLSRVIPYAVCPTCQGHQRKNCTLCKGRGFISKFLYTTAIPETTRKMREKGAKK